MVETIYVGTARSHQMRVSLDDGAFSPVRAHQYDAGLDLRTPAEFTVPPNGKADVNLGVHVEIPKGYVGLITSKSGLMLNDGITVRGTIDCGYTGPIKAIVFNHSGKDKHFNVGDKVCQLVIIPAHFPELVLVGSLEETERGDNGFGSTGK